MYEQPSRINCSIWLDASQRSRDGVRLNRSVREVKINGPEDWILRYIKTCLFTSKSLFANLTLDSAFPFEWE